MSLRAIASPIGLPSLSAKLPSPVPGYLIGACLGFVEFSDGWLELPLHDHAKIFWAELLINLLGVTYTIYCVYRIHTVLAEETSGQYSITPAKAAVLLCVPFFNLYWIFVWTNRLTDFVNSRAQPNILKGSLGVAVIAALALGEIDRSLSIIATFGVLHLILRKLERTLAPLPQASKAVKARPKIDKIRVALSAGLGSGFSLLLFLALLRVIAEIQSGWLWLRDFCVITIVALGVVFYFEPLFEQVRFGIGFHPLAENHTSQERRAWRLRIFGFCLICLISFIHAELHSTIESKEVGPEGAAVVLCAAVMIIATITYTWIYQAQRGRRTAWLGAGVGAITGGGVCSFLLMLSHGQYEHVQLDFNDAAGLAVENSASFAICGFAGGLALDQRWGGNVRLAIALGLLVALPINWLVTFLLPSILPFERIMPFEPTFRDMLYNTVRSIFAVSGWIGGLLGLGLAVDDGFKPDLSWDPNQHADAEAPIVVE